MEKTSTPKKKVKKKKRELLKTGTYVRMKSVSDRVALDERLQWSLVGMTAPVISRDEPALRPWVMELTEFFGTPEGYFVETKEILQYLREKDLWDAAHFFKQDMPERFFWVAPESCEELKKEKLN